MRYPLRYSVSWAQAPEALSRYSLLGGKTFLHAMAYSIPPAVAFTTLTESAKFYAIFMSPQNSTAFNSETKHQVESAYKKVGCNTTKVRFFNAGQMFPSTLTSVFKPGLVLFSCRPPKSARESKELYAMAGHEAVHTKERHELISEFAFFMVYETAYNLLRPSFVHAPPVFLAATLIAAAPYCSLARTLEKRADIVSANKLGTSHTLFGIFKQHEDEPSGSVHPSFSARANYLPTTSL